MSEKWKLWWKAAGVRAVKTIAPDLYRHHRSIRPVE